MGYYSDFEIEVDGEIIGSWKTEDMLKDLMEISGYTMDEGGVSEAKWYSYHEDLVSLSEKYPDKLICLTKYGGDTGDIKRFYYKGGKSQQVKFTWEEFDETKLES
jgi:hypothetical protein